MWCKLKNIDIFANARMDIEQARLLTLKTAWMMDNVDAKEARIWISMIKTVVPNVSIRIVDEAIQMFGALGVSQDTPLANMYMAQRTLRLADGPDEVHRMVVGRNELKKYVAQDGVRATFRDGWYLPFPAGRAVLTVCPAVPNEFSLASI